jgi:hypothetical protein
VLVYRAAALQFICTFYSTLFDALGLQTEDWSLLSIRSPGHQQAAKFAAKRAKRGDIHWLSLRWDGIVFEAARFDAAETAHGYCHHTRFGQRD